ncbi:hypothetical protein GGU10DRAFT_378382 [Lentinula aff. detonsa]|uniref:Uncharacterized protein n=1 Tax=Lentinula aff. detonsa TaxID=2804958 RepID=A0AA38K8S2_9AGAR|nr:hypothetical protein GGU10DRAFT_378382 [Lentinula aff. detonsa]
MQTDTGPSSSEVQAARWQTLLSNPLLLSLDLTQELNISNAGTTLFSSYAGLLAGLPEPLTAASLFSPALLLRIIDLLNELQAEVKSIKEATLNAVSHIETSAVLSDSQKNDVLAAAKMAVFDPTRVVFSNDSIVSDGYKLLEKYQSRNAFTPHFTSPTTKFAKLMRDELRTQASYAKTLLKISYLKTLYGKHASGVTKATQYVALAMTGSDDGVGLRETARALIMRKFIREQVDKKKIKVPAFITQKTGSKKRRRLKNSLQTLDLSPGHSDANETEDDGDKSDRNFWRTLNDWFKKRTVGKASDESELDDNSIEDSEFWGPNLTEEKWHEYLEECLNEEAQQYPQDKVEIVPRRARSAPSFSMLPMLSPLSTNNMTQNLHPQRTLSANSFMASLGIMPEIGIHDSDRESLDRFTTGNTMTQNCDASSPIRLPHINSFDTNTPISNSRNLEVRHTPGSSLGEVFQAHSTQRTHEDQNHPRMSMSSLLRPDSSGM